MLCRLHLQYVDALSAVRCVAIAAAEDVQGEASPSQLVATVLRNDILASIKGGAGLDLKTLHSAISEGTLKTLAADLVRRCVSYTVTFDRLCVTHGFLLDLWSQQQNSIFGNSSDLRTVLSPLTYNPATKTVEGRSDASSVAVALILELQVLYLRVQSLITTVLTKPNCAIDRRVCVVTEQTIPKGGGSR
jgi:hypothetical protein